MLPAKYSTGPSSAMRKSRMEGKPSLLPKPRRPGSIDRLSTDNPRANTTGHRSSNTGPRSSSAEPSRGTFAVGRLSREVSATKLAYSGRVRSQTGEAKLSTATTPLRTSHYPRPTTTPMRAWSQVGDARFSAATTTPKSGHYPRSTTTPRTPSQLDERNWQTSLDRALAFVTIKDQRPISNVAWQRSEYARVSELLSQRGEPDHLALIRPLTIAKFVEVTGALLSSIHRDAKLNTDNYVTKLPHLSKRLLYPGAMSKAWLRSVNTLHAFPHALALVAYLLDLLAHIEMPVDEEWMYVENDELATLRRDYFVKCWTRFQEPGAQFDDLDEEYLQCLTALLGNEEKLLKLPQDIKELEEKLEDRVELAARAEEARRRERHEALVAALRNVRVGRRRAIDGAEAERTLRNEHEEQLKALDVDIERARLELERLVAEVEQQPLSVAARGRLLDEVDYLMRVHDSKASLADQIDKTVLKKETELALWQKRTLESCAEYKQRLIQLTAHFPQLAELAVDEKELMGEECAASVGAAAAALRALAAEQAARRAAALRSRAAACRKRAHLLDEQRAKSVELKACIEREQQALDAEINREAADAAAWSAEEHDLNAKLEALHAHQEEYEKVQADLDFWENQDLMWQTNLSKLQEYIENQKEESQRLLEATRNKRIRLLLENIKLWNMSLEQ